jgi:phosphatidylserine synthase
MSPIDAPRSDSLGRDSRWRPIARIENLVTGGVVILVGLALLADNLGIHLPVLAWDNWWALFILMGGVSPAIKAVTRWRVAGFDARVAHGLLCAVTIVVVATMFLLGVSFGQWWPVFVIIGGLYTMFPGQRRRDRQGD